MARTYDQMTNLALFACIVRLGSLTAAAQHLGQSRSSVSKQLKNLEEKLGAKLLRRTTRSLSLTEVGQEILIEANKVEQAFLMVEHIRDDHQNDVRGRLKISCSSSLGRTHLVPVICEFSKQFPQVEMNLQLEDRYVDFVGEQIDVAIRIGHLQDSSLIARKLGHLNWQLCASPSFLEKFGRPKSPLDLVNFECLCYENRKSKMNIWEFTGPEGEISVEVKGPLFVNDATALVQAAVAGLGVLMADEAMLGDNFKTGKLEKVLTKYQLMQGLPVYLVYPVREYLPARTQAFISYIIENLTPRLH